LLLYRAKKDTLLGFKIRTRLSSILPVLHFHALEMITLEKKLIFAISTTRIDPANKIVAALIYELVLQIITTTSYYQTSSID